MFSVKGKPLAQANIKNDSIRKLRRLPDEFSRFLDADEKRSDSRKLNAGSESVIGNLRFGFSGVSLKARVIEKSEVRAVTSKDGTPLLVCDVTLSDGTGEIPLAVWNSQIGTISKGDLVRIQNARVRSFRGQIQLSLTRKVGLLTVLEPASKERRAAA
jgi:ssDNA-binding replication factor A large subunit